MLCLSRLNHPQVTQPLICRGFQLRKLTGSFQVLALLSLVLIKLLNPLYVGIEIRAAREAGVCVRGAEGGKLPFFILLWTRGLGTAGLGENSSIHPPWAGPLQRWAAPLCRVLCLLYFPGCSSASSLITQGRKQNLWVRNMLVGGFQKWERELKWNVKSNLKAFSWIAHKASGLLSIKYPLDSTLGIRFLIIALFVVE